MLATSHEIRGNSGAQGLQGTFNSVSPLTGDINMANHKVINLGTPHPTENGAVVNMGFFNTQVNESNLNFFT